MPIVNRPLSVRAEAVWRRIVSRPDAAFRPVRGRPFTYEGRNRAIRLHTTNWMNGRGAVEQVLTRMPLDPAVLWTTWCHGREHVFRKSRTSS